MLCLLILDKRHLRSIPGFFLPSLPPHPHPRVGSVTFYTYLSCSLPDSLAPVADQAKFIRAMSISLVPVLRVHLLCNLSSNPSPFPAQILYLGTKGLAANSEAAFFRVLT